MKFLAVAQIILNLLPPSSLSTDPARAPQAKCRVLGSQTGPKRTIHRGMYASLNTCQVGLTIPDPKDQAILGNREKEDRLLEYSVTNGFDSLSLYDVPPLLSTPRGSQVLSDFIVAARECGLNDIYVVGSTAQDWKALLAYQNSFPGKANGLLIESEFWNLPAAQLTEGFLDFIAMLKTIRSTRMASDGSQNLKVAAYLGWLDRDPNLTETQVASQIALLLDRLYLHCYVNAAEKAFDHCRSRFINFQSTQVKLEIFPIFSSEGEAFRAGSDSFMGDWLQANSIQAAEDRFNADVAHSLIFNPNSSNLNLGGFQYYEYIFLDYYTRAHVNPSLCLLYSTQNPGPCNSSCQTSKFININPPQEESTGIPFWEILPGIGTAVGAAWVVLSCRAKNHHASEPTTPSSSSEELLNAEVQKTD